MPSSPAVDDWGVERWIAQLAWTVTLGREGGLFFFHWPAPATLETVFQHLCSHAITNARNESHVHVIHQRAADVVPDVSSGGFNERNARNNDKS
jgi:hypothetical protein